MTLRIAIRILCESNCKKRTQLLTYAYELIEWFVQKSKNFYGPTFCTYNVNILVHHRDDLVKHNDNLNAISAFKFEIKLQSIKKLVRSSCNPLSQIVKRISEQEDANKSFLKIYIFDKVSIIERDSWFLLKSGS